MQLAFGNSILEIWKSMTITVTVSPPVCNGSNDIAQYKKLIF